MCRWPWPVRSKHSGGLGGAPLGPRQVARHSPGHLGGLFPILPVARLALRMSDRDDSDFLVGDVVYDLIGESTDRNAPSTSLRIERPNVRLGLNERGRGRHVIEELDAKAGMALLVPVYRRRELFTCGWMVPNVAAHRPRTSRSILRLVSSQDSSSAEPDSRSATRRLISLAHANAASRSAGPSRLARSSRTSSDRPCRSRRSASARTVSVAFVIRVHITYDEVARQGRWLAKACEGRSQSRSLTTNHRWSTRANSPVPHQGHRAPACLADRHILRSVAR